MGSRLPDAWRTVPQIYVNFSIAGNAVTICMEPENLTSFKQAMESQATAEAMAFDGVKRETVKTLVLDKEMKLSCT